MGGRGGDYVLAEPPDLPGSSPFSTHLRDSGLVHTYSSPTLQSHPSGPVPITQPVLCLFLKSGGGEDEFVVPQLSSSQNKYRTTYFFKKNFYRTSFYLHRYLYFYLSTVYFFHFCSSRIQSEVLFTTRTRRAVCVKAGMGYVLK